MHMPVGALQLPSLQVLCRLLFAARLKPGRQVVLQLPPDAVLEQL
jgi:hypothetical protein